jgi:hypothetical protein
MNTDPTFSQQPTWTSPTEPMKAGASQVLHPSRCRLGECKLPTVSLLGDTRRSTFVELLRSISRYLGHFDWQALIGPRREESPSSVVPFRIPIAAARDFNIPPQVGSLEKSLGANCAANYLNTRTGRGMYRLPR